MKKSLFWFFSSHLSSLRFPSKYLFLWLAKWNSDLSVPFANHFIFDIPTPLNEGGCGQALRDEQQACPIAAGRARLGWRSHNSSSSGRININQSMFLIVISRIWYSKSTYSIWKSIINSIFELITTEHT